MPRLAIFAGVLIGALLLALVLARADLGLALSALRQAALAQVIWAPPLMLVAYAAKAVRWQLLLPTAQAINWRRLYYPVCLGAAGNALLPHAGELLRASWLRRHHSAAVTATLTGIAVERMFDFLAIALLSLLVLLPAAPDHQLANALKFVAAAFGLLLLAFVLVLLWPQACRRLGNWLLQWAPTRLSDPVLAEFDQAVATLALLRRQQQLLWVLLWSLAQWLLIGLALYLCIVSVGLQVSVATTTGVLLLTVAGLTLPTAPGYVGTLQACFLVGLASLGAPAQALAASLLYNLTVTLLPIAIAVPALLEFGWRGLWRTAR